MKPSLFIYFYFIYLFLAILGLHCCMRALSSCGERGLLFVAVHRLRIAVASLVAEHRLWTRRPTWPRLTGPAAPWHAGSSRIGTRTHIPCIGRQTPNHCATREARGGFSCCGARALGAWASVVVAFRLSSCGSRAQPLRGMRDPSRPGLEPASPALTGRLSTTAPPGKPKVTFFNAGFIYMKCPE